MNSLRKANPDFSVLLSDSSSESVSQIYCEDPRCDTATFLNEVTDTPFHILQTDNACVVVSDLNWTETTTLIVHPDRPAFCMVVNSSPTLTLQFGHEDVVSETIKPGHLIFLVPGKKITSYYSPGTLRTVICSFETSFAEQILGPLHAMSPEQLKGALNLNNSLITSILFRLMKEAMFPSPMSESVMDALGNAMLVECAYWLQAEPAAADLRGKLTAQHFAIIERHLSDSTGRIPSVADMARECGFSERYFLKLFRDQTNCSIAQYIKSVQMSKAKSYLQETTMQPKEIAYRLGFSSAANFTTAFRVATGFTPGQYRKQKI